MSMTINSVGVVGCGMMGGGIAQVCASHGYEVTVLEADQDRLDRGLAGIRARLARDVERGRLTQERYESALRRLRGTLDMAQASPCEGHLLRDTIRGGDRGGDGFLRLHPPSHGPSQGHARLHRQPAAGPVHL